MVKILIQWILSPITSYGALDLPTYYIDLTPFVPLLADGTPHNVSLDVISAEKNHTIDDNWFLSGNIQVSSPRDRRIHRLKIYYSR